MKKKLDKLKQHIRIDKNLFVFLLILTIIGIIVGSIFVTILNKDDQGLISQYLNSFLDRIQSNDLNHLLAFKNSIISNIIFIIIIWLLGISIIGLPIIVIMFFSKAFILGFSIGSIIFNFHFKGIIMAIIYSLGQAVGLLIIMVLTMYAMSFSFKLINCLFKKKILDFKYMINKYLFVLGFVLIIILLVCLYDSYLVPNLLHHLISFIR